MAAEPYKYWAFISYSHQDSTAAAWLHQALESYLVPRRLVGRTTPLGAIPRRLFPVFRDRDELSSSAELGEAINEALRRSRYQIVICSPRAAASRWVNEEIRYFKSLGREDRVLALIIDGDPGAGAAGTPERECFPPALRHRVDADGAISSRPTEPIAADMRRSMGGRSEARLKLIAGLLGLDYDALRQRERTRRRWQRLRWAAGAAALVLALTAAWQAEQGIRAEHARQARLARLLDAGRKESLLGHPARAATLLSAAYSGGLDSPALRLLLRRAMNTIDAQTTIRTHHDDDAAGIAAWMPDGTRFVTLWHNAKLWDAGTGALLATLGDSNYSADLGVLPNADGSRLAVEGRPEFTEERSHVDLYDTASGKRLLHAAGGATACRRGNAFRSFTPDGSKLAVIDPFGTVAIYATDDGRLLRHLPSRNALSAGFSADGRRLVTAGDDGSVTVWDAASGRSLLAFASGQGPRIQAFFAPDGRLFVTDSKGKVRIRDGDDGRLIDALGGHTRDIIQAQISADGRRLLTNSDDGAKVWDLATGDQLLSVPCQCTVSVDYDLDPTGAHLLSRIDSLRVAIWNVDEQRLLTTLGGHSSEVNSLIYSPDGTKLLTAGVDGDAVIWRVTGIQPEPAITLRHDAPIVPDTDPETYSGVYSPDGQTIVTAGSDGTARLWNAADGRLLHVLRGHSKTVYHAAFSPDGRLLATASDDLTARLWDVGSGAVRAVLGGHNRFVRRVVFSPDGSRLLTVAGTEPRIWDTGDGRLIARLTGPTAPAVAGSFSSDGKRVLTTGIDGSPRIFDAATGAVQLILAGHSGVVPFARFVDHDQHVISAGVDGTARLWSAESGRQLAIMNEPLAGAGGFRDGSLSHDGSRALLSASTGELLLWRWRDGSVKRFTGHSIASYWSEFSADDRLAVSASNDGTSRLWSVDTGAELAVLSLGTRISRMWSASFDPSAEHVVTTGYSNPPTAEVWAFPRETRSPAQIAAILRCKTPWQIDGEQLVAHRPEAKACAGVAR